jgi:hypothetical protein
MSKFLKYAFQLKNKRKIGYEYFVKMLKKSTFYVFYDRIYCGKLLKIVKNFSREEKLVGNFV